ncbi:FG-GAP repeat protein [Gilvimarinus xylanilyticus]|uniref:FG-GAP repeat protein n=1 Tax=Gilvimarinus xylanilyticus TaxID=2944139 RepID=A0A9X2HYP7_9GAMM|nr:FG-GAP repeat protein [Gilvimarinus xylanilyticus]MCP8897758.1 FG-GAP repeat protein [Gilvimarinus xylanilyticus]
MTQSLYPFVKRLGLVPCLLATFALTACGSDDDDDSTASSSSSSSISSSSSTSSASSAPAEAAWPDINIEGAGVKTLRVYWDAVPEAAFYRVYKDPDGSSGFTQLGEDVTAPEIYDNVSVHTQDWAEARYMVEACTSESACTNSNETTAVHAMLDAIGYLKASNTETYDWFGWSLDLSADGKTLAVGATQEDSIATGVNGDQDDNTNFATGAVYVFQLEDSGWAQQAYIKASNTEYPRTIEDDEGEEYEYLITDDRFGYAVSLSNDGNTLAVSALREDSNARGINGEQDNNSASDAGAVYIFERSEGSWAQTAYVKASNTPTEESTSSSSSSSSSAASSSSSQDSNTAGDRFGQSLDLSGDGTTLVVGAIGEDSSATGIDGDQQDNSLSLAGAAYVFIKTDSGWSQQAYVKPSQHSQQDRFGSAVALSASGDRLAVGAIGEDWAAVGVDGETPEENSTAFNSGAVYIFARSAGEWSQQAYLKPAYAHSLSNYPGAGFGNAVSFSDDGNTLAVGASAEGSLATGVNGDPSNFPSEENPVDGSGTGAAYIFEFSGDEWQQKAYIKASNPNIYDRFGQALRLSADGSMLAVGAYREDGGAVGIDGNQDSNDIIDAGAIYIFQRIDNAWQQSHYVKGIAADKPDRLGQAVALSENGDTLATSAYREAGSGTGVDADPSDNDSEAAGAVLLY